MTSTLDDRQLSEVRPAVSILIPCRNEAAHINSCLGSVLSQQPPPGGFEVIVADGQSSDGTKELLTRLSAQDNRLSVIDNAGRIVSTGLNAAIKAARADVVLRMDAHTEYAPDYVQQCLAVLHEIGADNVGGPWLARGTGYLARAIAAAFQSPFAVGTNRGHNAAHEGPVDTVYLGCWPKSVFARVGPFDEQLVRNQDDEHNLRLTRAGGLVWQSPRIRSWYRPRGSLVALFRQYAQYGYWKVWVIRKHRLPASARHLVPALFLVALALLALAAPFSTSALWGLAGLVGLYLAALAVAAMGVSRTAGWDLLPVLPVVFCCYHFGYGYGFLRGLADVTLRRQRPGPAFTALTRPAPEAAPTPTTARQP